MEKKQGFFALLFLFHFEGEYAVVETKEKEESIQKKVRYTVGKENDVWKIEDIRVIGEG
ncbi:hypothetical protein V7166_03810 [Bacillus thuringiensis]